MSLHHMLLHHRFLVFHTLFFQLLASLAAFYMIFFCTRLSATPDTEYLLQQSN